ncbi:hypothetical protein Q8A67_022731 [Cirrhinus molitorella]|uniref:Uncharacterized protein n=1 Tax=Cirrhinus molitorella TaxID=172907 RepID=A0AA88PA50_9TELE|nr:hypothetical protein Q8A67_022731 [Cirrhinus molitorella]
MKILPVWNNVRESASASSHAERTQQRSECGRSPGASAPTTASPVSRIAAPYQSTLSLSGGLEKGRSDSGSPPLCSNLPCLQVAGGKMWMRAEV